MFYVQYSYKYKTILKNIVSFIKILFIYLFFCLHWVVIVAA